VKEKTLGKSSKRGGRLNTGKGVALNLMGGKSRGTNMVIRKQKIRDVIFQKDFRKILREAPGVRTGRGGENEVALELGVESGNMRPRTERKSQFQNRRGVRLRGKGRTKGTYGRKWGV